MRLLRLGVLVAAVFAQTVVCWGIAQENPGQTQQKSPGAEPGPVAGSLLEVQRIYVAPLTGDRAEQVRDLIIAGLNASKLFLLTENEERADAILKGTAEETAFIDTFDSQDGISMHANAGAFGGGTFSSKAKGGYGGVSVGDSEATHIKERKHEAYAAVRLCNRAGDVLWSTTQESQGAKFRGAGADVAVKIARQLALDLNRARHPQPAVSSNSAPSVER